jgi:hypothetical protein
MAGGLKFLFVGAALALTACGGGTLSDAEATKAIRAHFGYPEMVAWREVESDLDTARGVAISEAVGLGYLTLNGQWGPQTQLKHEARLAPTEKGRKIFGDSGRYWGVGRRSWHGVEVYTHVRDIVAIVDRKPGTSGAVTVLFEEETVPSPHLKELPLMQVWVEDAFRYPGNEKPGKKRHKVTLEKWESGWRVATNN